MLHFTSMTSATDVFRFLLDRVFYDVGVHYALLVSNLLNEPEKLTLVCVKCALKELKKYKPSLADTEFVSSLIEKLSDYVKQVDYALTQDKDSRLIYAVSKQDLVLLNLSLSRITPDDGLISYILKDVDGYSLVYYLNRSFSAFAFEILRSYCSAIERRDSYAMGVIRIALAHFSDSVLETRVSEEADQVIARFDAGEFPLVVYDPQREFPTQILMAIVFLTGKLTWKFENEFRSLTRAIFSVQDPRISVRIVQLLIWYQRCEEDINYFLVKHSLSSLISYFDGKPLDPAKRSILLLYSSLVKTCAVDDRKMFDPLKHYPLDELSDEGLKKRCFKPYVKPFKLADRAPLSNGKPFRRPDGSFDSDAFFKAKAPLAYAKKLLKELDTEIANEALTKLFFPPDPEAALAILKDAEDDPIYALPIEKIKEYIAKRLALK